jgi:hypothetical protein
VTVDATLMSDATFAETAIARVADRMTRLSGAQRWNDSTTLLPASAVAQLNDVINRLSPQQRAQVRMIVHGADLYCLWTLARQWHANARV